MLGMNSGAELVAWLHILSLVSIQLLFQSPQLLVYAYNVRLKILMFVKKREKSTLIHLYIRWTFKQGGGEPISGIISSLASRWAYIRGGGL